MALLMISACTASQRKAIAVQALDSSAAAVRCALACEGETCRTGCLETYGAALARDFLLHLSLASSEGAKTLEIEVPAPYPPPAADAGAGD